VDELTEAGFSNVTAVPVDNPPAGADPDEVVGVDPGGGEKAAPEQDITVSYVGRRSRNPTTGTRTSPRGASSSRPSRPRGSVDDEEQEEEPDKSSAPSDDDSSEKPSHEAVEVRQAGNRRSPSRRLRAVRLRPPPTALLRGAPSDPPTAGISGPAGQCRPGRRQSRPAT
jgi:hypothetical protein